MGLPPRAVVSGPSAYHEATRVLLAILNRSERAGTRLRKHTRQPPPLCETLFTRPVPGAGANLLLRWWT
jgi:Glu-tRNA(Gln) amidotransferase subunit E-like FAD-binding protein